MKHNKINPSLFRKCVKIDLAQHKYEAIIKYCEENNINHQRFFTTLLVNTILNCQFKAHKKISMEFRIPRELCELIYTFTDSPGPIFLNEFVAQAVDKGLEDISLLPKNDTPPTQFMNIKKDYDRSIKRKPKQIDKKQV